MADVNLTVGIHSSEAERGAKKIVDALNDIDKAADKLSDGADFHLDTREFDRDAKKVKETLKDIESEVDDLSSTPAKIDIDTSGVDEASKKVRDALSSITGKEAKVTLGIDAEGIAAETADIVNQIKEEVDRNLERGIPVEASLKVATDAAVEEINKVMEKAGEEIEIPVTADTSQAQDEVTKLRQGFIDITDDGNGGRNMTIRFEGDEAIDEIGKVSEAVNKIDGKGAKIEVDVDASNAASEVNRAQSAFDRALDAVNKFIRGLVGADKELSEVDASAKKAAASVEDMSNALGEALRNDEMLELAAEAVLAIATSIGTAIIAFEDYQDAVRAATGDSEAAGVAMEMIEGFARDTAFSIEDVTAAFVELRSSGLDASRESLTSYGNVAAGLNLTMEELAAAVGDAAQGNFSKLNDTQLKAVASGDKVKFTYQGVTTTVDNTGKAVAAFIKQMGNTEFAGLMEEQADGATGALETMSEAWHELSRDIGEGGLTRGIEEFSHSMARASEAADGLARLFGGFLEVAMTAIGRTVEGVVDRINMLIDAFKWLKDAINSIPSVSNALGYAKDLATEYLFPNLKPNEPKGEEQGPPTDPNRTNSKAFGSDTNLPRRPTRTAKTEAQRQEEDFNKQFAANDYMIRTLGHMDDAYARGRESVVGFRNAIEEAGERTSITARVGEKYAETLIDQAVAMRTLKENIAIKEDVMDQEEAIMQTLDLAVAQKRGSAAVQETQAAIEGYNRAVELGVVSTPELRDKFTELAWEAMEAKKNLKFEESMVGFDQQIDSAARMATAFREGGPAIREAALEQEVYAQAVALGKENDEQAIQTIRDKLTALRDLKEIAASDELAMNVGFDLEQGEGEIRISRLNGEARDVERAKLDMLMQKKRELKDATAQLTADEEKLAESLGKLSFKAEHSGRALLDLADQYMDVNKQMENAAMGGALALEDSLVDIATGAKSAREAFADFASSVAEQLMRAAIQMAIIGPLMRGMGMAFGGVGFAEGGIMTSSGPRSLPKYANGGIMSSHGDIPLKTYSRGGIANSPQMAIFGEGKMPEAFVPLPDGRRIPVKMEGDGGARGGGGGGISVVNQVSVTMPQGATKEDGTRFGDQIARQIEDAMNANLLKQQRPGGILDPNGYGAA